MVEIRLHGRGGQGIVIGSSILGMAFFLEGRSVQFFPEFGVERRGAPVQAFLRVGDTKIKAHYSIYEPDHVILFDYALFNRVKVTDGLKTNGWLLINSRKTPDEFAFGEKYRIATVDADGIALKNNLGSSASPIINSAIAGAFARIMGNVSLNSVAEAIMELVPSKVEENIASARSAFKEVIIGSVPSKAEESITSVSSASKVVIIGSVPSKVKEKIASARPAYQEVILGG